MIVPGPHHRRDPRLGGARGLHGVEHVASDALFQERRRESARHERGNHHQREERERQGHSPLRGDHGRGALRSATRVVSRKVSTSGKRGSRPWIGWSVTPISVISTARTAAGSDVGASAASR